jgi:hypothetical protein
MTRAILLGIGFFILSVRADANPVLLTGVVTEESCEDAQAVLRDGDLIFTELRNPFFRRFAVLYASWVNHVGVAFRDPQLGWVVYEGAVPFSRRTPLCRFLRPSLVTRFAVRRLDRILEAPHLAALRASLERRMGVTYDLGFNLYSWRQFCSKLVYESFLEAFGIEIGRRQTFQQMREEHPEINYRFAELWFGDNDIPWERVTVTPGSQYEDSDLYGVLEVR